MEIGHLFSFAIALTTQMLSSAAVGRSPPPPPDPPLAQLIKNSIVIVAKGSRFRWLTFGNVETNEPPREVDGPTGRDGSHIGTVVLEADLLSRLQCIGSCPQSQKVLIRLGRLNTRKSLLPLLLGEPRIYLVNEIGFKKETSFVPDMLKEWLVTTGDQRGQG